jgi:hypothetical protein
MEACDSMSLEPRMARICTDKGREEANAGTPGARAGRGFATASASQLATAISITHLHSLRK